MIELLVPQDDGTEKRVRLDGTTLIMGRSSDAHLRLFFDSVARRHARLTERDGRLYVEDLGSTNGTEVRGEQIRDAGHRGVRIEVGDTIGLAERPRLTLVAHEPVIAADFETREAGFLEPLSRDADDDATRAVYGDFLEEQGEELRAQWLRAELARRRAPDGTATDDLRELTTRLIAAPRWRMLMSRPRIERCATQRCPGRWHLLAPHATERDHAYVARTCGRCGERVSYEDTVSDADDLDRPRLIAIDRLTARPTRL